MPLLGRRTEEERAAKSANKQLKADDAVERKRLQNIEKARRAFFKSPAGRAREAFEQDDQVFQYSFDVMNQSAIIVPMVGSNTLQKSKDPVAILNSVCREGWELVNGSFVFVEQGAQSRDKFGTSGQNVAIKGKTVGYYLFSRCEENRRAAGDPWEAVTADDEIELVDEG